MVWKKTHGHLFSLLKRKCLRPQLMQNMGLDNSQKCRCDVIVLSYHKACQSEWNPPHITYLFDKNSTWRTGRNLLFCDYWRGSDRMGETLSSFGRYYRWQAFLVTSPYRCEKEFRKQTEPPEKEFVLEQKRPIGLVLQDNVSICNADLLHSLEVFHRRAARIIYKLPRDMPTDEVYRHSNWNTLTLHYKLRLSKLLHSVFIG